MGPVIVHTVLKCIVCPDCWILTIYLQRLCKWRWFVEQSKRHVKKIFVDISLGSAPAHNDILHTWRQCNCRTWRVPNFVVIGRVHSNQRTSNFGLISNSILSFPQPPCNVITVKMKLFCQVHQLRKKKCKFGSSNCMKGYSRARQTLT